MLPIGPLMIEHRLIEKMVKLLSVELDRLKAGGKINRSFNLAAVDFFRVYADRTHHGKEENILFSELEKKDLSSEHRETMAKLIGEHGQARESVKALESAQTEAEAIDCLRRLAGLYPGHIEKEDKDFFIPVMDYFSEAEKEAMLRAGQEFDQGMIHEKYKKLVDDMGK